MRFLYPNMLWGLFALLIPILIHLFNFRRHKLVYFSNTAVLRSIQQCHQILQFSRLGILLLNGLEYSGIAEIHRLVSSEIEEVNGDRNQQRCQSPKYRWI